MAYDFSIEKVLPASWNMIKSQNIIKLSEVVGNKLSSERMTSC